MRISPSAATRGMTRQAPVVRRRDRFRAASFARWASRWYGHCRKRSGEHRTAPAAGLPPVLLEALRRTRCGCSRREKRFLNLNVRGREPLSKFSNKMSIAGISHNKMYPDIQGREYSWPKERYQGDYELYGNNSRQRADLVLHLQGAFDPSALVI